MNPSGSDRITAQHNFLSTLAKGLTSEQHLLVARKVLHEGREVFPAEEWREQYLDGPWYFSTGASNDRRSRKRENMVALRAIVLDDVGTKVDPGKILAAPTWVLETSAGNFQWGYLLKEWTTDIEGGDALFAGLVEAGLQDPGVNKCCRLFRIPGSVNDKPGRDGFVSVLIDFNPDLVYTLKSLAAALKVKPGHATKPKLDTGERPAAGKPDPTFEWLREKDMVQGKASGGWWYIDCPFGDEHTDGRDEARYLPAFESMTGRPNVECWHGHGQDKDAYRARFKQWLANEKAPPMDDANPTGDLESFRAFMRNLPTGKPKPQVRKQQPAEPVEKYTFGSLRKALGTIPKEVLPEPDRTKEGFTKMQPCNYENIEGGLAHLGVQVRLNLMNGKTSYILPERIDMAGFGTKTASEVDGMIEAALLDCYSGAGMRNKKELRDGLARIANSLYWHPAADWITSVPWDGVDRFEALCASVATQTPDLFRKYFRRWALQGIEAACGWEVRREEQKPLCLVLVGKQGIGKSRWLMALAPGFTAGGKHLSLDSVGGGRDSKHEALQAWLVELGELDTTLGRSANGSLKAFISTETDEYRLPYASEWLTRPRCTSFCGSVNDERFLRDTTGSRRWAAVKVEHCDPAHGIDMQQFWAQVHTWWRDGEPWWLSDAEVAQQAESNERFNIDDGIAEKIEDEIAKRQDRNIYTLECSLSQTQVSELLNLRYEQNGILARVRSALEKHLGKHQNLRERCGMKCTSRGWVWWLTTGEVESLEVTPLRPVKV